MPTITIVLSKPTSILKKIEFTHHLNLSTGGIVPTKAVPTNFQFVELVRPKGSEDTSDVMFAYDHDRRYGMFYIGRWNDGVV